MKLSATWRLRWTRVPGRRSGAGRTVHLRRVGTVGPRAQPAAVDDRALQTERAGVDVGHRLACRSEAAMRRELGCAARVVISRRLGFVRLSVGAGARDPRRRLNGE